MNNWDKIIKPTRNLFHLDLKELLKYRGLLKMLVFRDFVTYYKQTILGPLWFFLQPIFTAAVNLFVFGKLAGIGPNGVPGFLVPLTILISGLLKFSVQLCLLILAIAYYYFTTDFITIQDEIIFFPLLILIVMTIALGFGLLVSSLTTKYRDLKFFIDFIIPLARYITPGIATSYVIFIELLPSSLVPIVKYNPIGHLIDAFNYMFVGVGTFDWMNIFYCVLFALSILFFGIIIFNQVEKKFMDTV